VLSADGVEILNYTPFVGEETRLRVRQGRLRLRVELPDRRSAERDVEVPPASRPEMQVEIRVP
jgi:hypothetical protein